jgi:hypothetical protein
VLPALAKLGFWGVGLVALIDSSSLPVPMDADPGRLCLEYKRAISGFTA